jgi:ornithine--oxo-acid transaminase
MRLFKDHVILTQIYGNDCMVLKIAPPLLVSEMQLSHCVESTLSVVERVHPSTLFWIDALNLGRRAMSS